MPTRPAAPLENASKISDDPQPTRVHSFAITGSASSKNEEIAVRTCHRAKLADCASTRESHLTGHDLGLIIPTGYLTLWQNTYVA